MVCVKLKTSQNFFGFFLNFIFILPGPCQMPALNLVVERADEILNFRPGSYFVLEVEVLSPFGDHMKLAWTRERECDRKLIYASLDQVQRSHSAKVIGFKSEVKCKKPPAALNAFEMLKLASSRLQISPHKATQIAEGLYLKGLISYPNTETNVYPPNFDFKSILRAQTCGLVWGHHARSVLENGINFPCQVKGSFDHPPITPTTFTYPDQTDSLSMQLYELICRHFIASLSMEMKYEQVFVKLRAGMNEFTWTGKRMIHLGFTDVLGSEMQTDQILKNALKVGDFCNLTSCNVACRTTKPPSHLSESDLIGLMEKKGIGTAVSIAQNIHSICEQNYVNLSEERFLIPTLLGRTLIHGFKRIDQTLVCSTFRVQIERKLKEILIGKRKYQDVLFESINLYRSKFYGFVQQIGAMDDLFEANFNETSDLIVKASPIENGENVEKSQLTGQSGHGRGFYVRGRGLPGVNRGSSGRGFAGRGKGGPTRGRGSFRRGAVGSSGRGCRSFRESRHEVENSSIKPLRSRFSDSYRGRMANYSSQGSRNF